MYPLQGFGPVILVKQFSIVELTDTILVLCNFNLYANTFIKSLLNQRRKVFNRSFALRPHPIQYACRNFSPNILKH